MQSGKYPPDWDKRRRKVYKRDDYTCQNCGARGGRTGDAELHAHHITPLSQGGSNRLSNLTTLCKMCHNAQHDHDITGDRRADHPKQGDTVNSSGSNPILKHFIYPLGGLFVYFLLMDMVINYSTSLPGLLSVFAMLLSATVLALAGLLIPFAVLRAYGWLFLFISLLVVFGDAFSDATQFFTELTTEGAVWEVAIAAVVVLYIIVAPLLAVISVGILSTESD